MGMPHVVPKLISFYGIHLSSHLMNKWLACLSFLSEISFAMASARPGKFYSILPIFHVPRYQAVYLMFLLGKAARSRTHVRKPSQILARYSGFTPEPSYVYSYIQKPCNGPFTTIAQKSSRVPSRIFLSNVISPYCAESISSHLVPTITK